MRYLYYILAVSVIFKLSGRKKSCPEDCDGRIIQPHRSNLRVTGVSRLSNMDSGESPYPDARLHAENSIIHLLQICRIIQPLRSNLRVTGVPRLSNMDSDESPYPDTRLPAENSTIRLLKIDRKTKTAIIGKLKKFSLG